MGFGGISPFQLIIILLIVLLLFGGKRLRTLGSDLGSAIKGFRKSMDEQSAKDTPPATLDQQHTHENTTQEHSKTSTESNSKENSDNPKQK